MEKCKQCEEGIEIWKDVTYEDLVNKHLTLYETVQGQVKEKEDLSEQMSLSEFVYKKLIPFSFFQQHYKYCQKKH